MRKIPVILLLVIVIYAFFLRGVNVYQTKSFLTIKNENVYPETIIITPQFLYQEWADGDPIVITLKPFEEVQKEDLNYGGIERYKVESVNHTFLTFYLPAK